MVDIDKTIKRIADENHRFRTESLARHNRLISIIQAGSVDDLNKLVDELATSSGQAFDADGQDNESGSSANS